MGKLLIESREGGIRALAVLTRIQAQCLVGLIHAQATVEQRLDYRGDHQVEHQHNSDRHHNAQNLRDEQRDIARVEQPALTGPRKLRHAEQAREHAAQDAADTMATASSASS